MTEIKKEKKRKHQDVNDTDEIVENTVKGEPSKTCRKKRKKDKRLSSEVSGEVQSICSDESTPDCLERQDLEKTKKCSKIFTETKMNERNHKEKEKRKKRKKKEALENNEIHSVECKNVTLEEIKSQRNEELIRSKDDASKKHKKKKRSKKGDITKNFENILKEDHSMKKDNRKLNDRKKKKKKDKEKSSCGQISNDDPDKFCKIDIVNIDNVSEMNRTSKKEIRKENQNSEARKSQSSMDENEKEVTLKSNICKVNKRKKRKQIIEDGKTIEEEAVTATENNPVPRKKKKKKKNADDKEEEVGNSNRIVTNNNEDNRNVKYSSTHSNIMGQWGTATLGDDQRQNKFLRLLGGCKAGSNNNLISKNFMKFSKANEVMALKGGVSYAMNKTEEENYKSSMSEQYEKAMSMNLHRGVGLGFDTSSIGKKFHIDKAQSKSVKFDDD